MRMKTSHAFLCLASLAVSACSSSPSQRDLESPWVETFEAPLVIETARMRLEPLQPKFNELDYQAAQGSRDHLRTTLQWGSWPSPEMTAEQNLGDLTRHYKEFTEREAYAYTVLHPSGSPCIGCVYLNPDKQDRRGLRMAYWVVADQLASGLDAHVVATVLEAIEADWPVDKVTIAHPVENPRGIRILREHGLEKVAENAEQITFAWQR